ncbi:hypothetical protein [Legionella sp. km772]|uniref:hypothetical protein n=1 Tax=Legionella sp. km772 TaxID=2498111 RepID=UPI000F8E277B|nr:hypothetical protein [Legionella sp. km772]RUR13828.1 hypothetical protein ELY15_01370 [Legionella sp. km772]
MDKVKAGAGALKDKLGSNIDDIDKQMQEKLSDDKGEKKKEEKDEDFVKSIMSMLRGLTEEVNLFRDDLKNFAKDKAKDLGENENFQKGLSGLKDVASDVASMAKGMLSKGPSPKAKDESEEGMEMQEVGAKKEKGADMEMSKPATSPSLKEVASRVMSAFSDLKKGLTEVMGSSSPSATAEKTEELEETTKLGMK